MLYYKQMPQYADKQTVTSLLYFKAKNSADFLIYFTQIFLQTLFFFIPLQAKRKAKQKTFQYKQIQKLSKTENFIYLTIHGESTSNSI